MFCDILGIKQCTLIFLNTKESNTFHFGREKTKRNLISDGTLFKQFCLKKRVCKMKFQAPIGDGSQN